MKKNIKDPFFSMFDEVFFKDHLTYSPNVKITKNENEYELFISVPGLHKDDLKISIKENEIDILFEKNNDEINHYFVSSFIKKYKIPEEVNQDKIEGKVENGVLKIKLPFSKKKQYERLLSLN